MHASVLLAALVWAAPLFAGEKPYYEKLRFRDDDPFVFCTQGIKDNPRAWSPLQPVNAVWRLTPGYCPVPTTGSCPVYPYTYKSWSDNDVASLQQYQQVCPRGEHEGRWRGRGKPENAPYSH